MNKTLDEMFDETQKAADIRWYKKEIERWVRQAKEDFELGWYYDFCSDVMNVLYYRQKLEKLL